MARRDALSRTLIVLPASLRQQWAEELSGLFGLQTTGADALWLRRRARELPADVNPWSLPGIYIASIDFIKRPEALEPLENVRWDLLVVDEAHGATPGSDRRAAVHSIACRSHHVVLLSATPHGGDDTQFEDLCSIGRLDEGEPPLVLFMRSRSVVSVEEDAAPRSVALAVRISDAERRMHRLLEDYTARLWRESSSRQDPRGQLLATFLRKRALSSAQALALSLERRAALAAGAPPPATQLSLPLEEDGQDHEDEPRDEILGAPGLEREGDERRWHSEMAEAASAAARDESKLRVLLRFLRRARQPAIVFSEYRDTASHVHERLCSGGFRAFLLHGGMSTAERRSALAAFAAGGSTLVATDAASEGLNLHHACRLVIHFELPWMPSRLRQRCGRINRIGQTRRVHEVALVANDTAEQLVLVPLMRRAARALACSATPLAHTLPELRVAEHVLAGTPLPPPSPPVQRAFVETMDLLDEARAEVARLELVRRLHPGVSPPRLPPAPLVITTARPRHQNRHATLLFNLMVSAKAGPVHRELVVFRVSLSESAAPDGWHAAPAAIKAQLRPLMAAMLPRIRRELAPLIATRLGEVQQLHRIRADLAGRRARAMAQQRRSTARALVQAGLFDRRAMRNARAKAQIDDMLAEERCDAAPPDGSEPPLAAGIELRAVFCGALP